MAGDCFSLPYPGLPVRDAGAVTVLVAGASAAIGTDMARFIWLAPSV